jgi:intraflagellar transport protein 56
MIPSRSRIKNPSSHTPDGSAGRRGATKEAHIPDLESLLKARDYAGACALLQFKRHANRNDTKTTEMLAYCQFHYGDHLKVCMCTCPYALYECVCVHGRTCT